MKKILFVILGLDFSGAENVLIQYLDGNNEIDPYFAFIYNGAESIEFAKKFGASKVRELALPYNKNELRILPCLVQRKVETAMQRIINEVMPDVIYFNNTHEVILSRALLKKIKIPSIGHVHDMMYSIGSLAKRFEARRAYRELNEVLTVSEACKKSWKCEKMKVVYNGVPDTFFDDGHNDEKRYKKLTIGYVGMLSDRKGFDILADIIESDCLPVNWKVAYNLIDSKYEGLLNKVKARDNVEVFYKIPSSEMKMFYDSIDVLVIPSRQDPLPTVAIEAMARNKLVIGFRIGGIPELIGDNRLIIDDINADALRNKIQDVLETSADTRKELADSIHERSIAMFSQKNKRDVVNELINEVGTKNVVR